MMLQHNQAHLVRGLGAGTALAPARVRTGSSTSPCAAPCQQLQQLHLTQRHCQQQQHWQRWWQQLGRDHHPMEAVSGQCCRSAGACTAGAALPAAPASSWQPKSPSTVASALCCVYVCVGPLQASPYKRKQLLCGSGRRARRRWRLLCVECLSITMVRLSC